MPANKIRLEICGATYVVSSTDTEPYVTELAERLDKNMNEVLSNNPSASVTTAAVLCALEYLDEWQKATSGADNMRAQIKDYLEDAAKAKMAAEEARREVERLKREMEILQNPQTEQSTEPEAEESVELELEEEEELEEEIEEDEQENEEE